MLECNLVSAERQSPGRSDQKQYSRRVKEARYHCANRPQPHNVAQDSVNQQP